MSVLLTAVPRDVSSSSSLRATENTAPFRLRAHGVDTVCFAWRPHEATLETFRAGTRQRRYRPGSRASRWVRYDVAGLQLGEFTEHGLLVAEGLAPLSALAEGAVRAAEAIEAATGARVEGSAAVLTRVDLASDVLFNDPVDGVLFLRSAAAVLHLPRLRTSPDFDTSRRLTSVTWAGSQGRWAALRRRRAASRRLRRTAPAPRVAVQVLQAGAAAVRGHSRGGDGGPGLAAHGRPARAPLSAAQAVEHLAGMQCQEPPAPFYGLWSRVEGFDPAELVRLLEEHAVLRTTLMRATLHLTTADDFLAWRPMHQAMLEKRFAGSGFAKQLDGVDVGEVIATGRAMLAETPGTTATLGRALAERWPAHDKTALAYAVRFVVPLAQMPPRGTSLERQGGPAAVAPVEELLGRPLAEETAPDALLLRYLAAFGPASVADMRMWSGLTGLAAAVDRLRPALRTFTDERGRELLDLPEAPIATGDEPAPPRFLPWFDNILLGHDDRSRVLPYGHRLGVVGGSAFVLVDGFARATWRIERTPGAATLHVQPLEPLGDTDEMVAEGERLLEFAAPAASRRRVVVEPAPGA